MSSKPYRPSNPRLAAISVFVGVISVGCDAPPKSLPTAKQLSPEEVHFQQHIYPLLARSCVVCHMTSAAQAQLNLEPRMAFASLIGRRSTEALGMRLVAPGDPTKSYMVHKLAGTHIEAGGSGDRMPQNAPPLSEPEMELLVNWIRNLPTDASETHSRGTP